MTYIFICYFTFSEEYEFNLELIFDELKKVLLFVSFICFIPFTHIGHTLKTIHKRYYSKEKEVVRTLSKMDQNVGY